MQYLCRLLKKDTDGVWFIDHLRVMAAQADDQAAYLRFLKAHRQLILDRLSEFKQLNSVLTKYGWLNYHQHVGERLGRRCVEQVGGVERKMQEPIP